MLYPHARVKIVFLFFIFIQAITLPAAFVLLWWVGWQFIAGLPQLTSMRPAVDSGVAVWAHIGGFLAGVLLARVFANRQLWLSHF